MSGVPPVIVRAAELGAVDTAGVVPVRVNSPDGGVRRATGLNARVAAHQEYEVPVVQSVHGAGSSAPEPLHAFEHTATVWSYGTLLV